MSHLPSIPNLRLDLVAASSSANDLSGSRKLATKTQSELSDYYESMKTKDPCYYNSLFDKYTSKHVQKPVVKKHLHQMGFTAVDGTVYPTKEEQIEANRINHLYKERHEKLRKLQLREQAHLRHLKKAARVGKVTFTKDGVFECNPCEEYEIHYQVDSRTKPRCQSSSLGKRPAAEEQEKRPKRLLNRRSSSKQESISVQTSRVETGHLFTQTSEKDCGLDITTQTSKRQLPDQSTQTSHTTFPEVGVQTSHKTLPTVDVQTSHRTLQAAVGVQTSHKTLPIVSDQTSLVHRPTKDERETSFKSVSQCQSRDSWSEHSTALPSSASFADSYSSYTEERDALRKKLVQVMVENKEVDEAIIAQVFVLEEKTLEEKLQEELAINHEILNCEAKLQIKFVERECAIQNELLKCKSAYTTELYRNTALQAILKTLADEQQRVCAVIEKQNALEKLRDQQHKMNVLIKAQIRLKLKAKLKKELVEKHQLLAATKTELADTIETKKKAQAENQDVLIMSYHEQEPTSSRPDSRLLMRESVQQVSESSPLALNLTNPAKQDATCALSALKQIKRDMKHLFPQVDSRLVVKERIPCFSLPHVPSEKLPSAPLSNQIVLASAHLASTKEESKSTRSLSQRPSKISQSTLATIEKAAIKCSQPMGEPTLEQSIKGTTSQTTMEELQHSGKAVMCQTAMEDSPLQKSTKDSATQTTKDSATQTTKDSATQTTKDSATQTTMNESRLYQSTKDAVSHDQTITKKPPLQKSTEESATQTTAKEQQSARNAVSQTVMEEQKSANDAVSQTVTEEPPLQKSTKDAISQTTIEEPSQLVCDSQSSRCNIPASIGGGHSSESIRFNGLGSCASTTTQSVSSASLCKRPSSIECQSSEDLRVDEGRVIRIGIQEKSSHTSLYDRPPSIECLSSEALRIDEGRIPESASEQESQQSPFHEKKDSYGSDDLPQSDPAGTLSTRRLPLQHLDTESLPAEDSKGISAEEATFASYSTLGCLSERWSELNSSEDECQQEDTDFQCYIQRVPTPPAYPRPTTAGPVRGVISCHSSLSKIKEGSPSDFSKEFVSPLIVNSNAVVPYHSQRTRLRLRTSAELTPREQKQERLRESRADLAEKEDEIRQSLLELLPPKSTLEEYYSAEAVELAPTPVLSSTASKTQLETAEEKATNTYLRLSIEQLQKKETLSSASAELLSDFPANTKTLPKSEGDKGNDKSLGKKSSATSLQQTSSVSMPSAESDTSAEKNASIAKSRAKARSASEEEIHNTESEPAVDVIESGRNANMLDDNKAALENKEVVCEQQSTLTKKKSNAIEPSQRELKASPETLNFVQVINDAPEASANEVIPITTEESSTPQTSTSAPTDSSEKKSRISSKEVVPVPVAVESVSIPPASSSTATKSKSKRSKASLKENLSGPFKKVDVSQSSSKSSIKSSKKRSKASLKEVVHVADDKARLPRTSSNSSSKKLRASPKEDLSGGSKKVDASPSSSKSSIKSSKKRSRTCLKSNSHTSNHSTEFLAKRFKVSPKEATTEPSKEERTHKSASKTSQNTSKTADKSTISLSSKENAPTIRENGSNHTTRSQKTSANSIYKSTEPSKSSVSFKLNGSQQSSASSNTSSTSLASTKVIRKRSSSSLKKASLRMTTNKEDPSGMKRKNSTSAPNSKRTKSQSKAESVMVSRRPSCKSSTSINKLTVKTKSPSSELTSNELKKTSPTLEKSGQSGSAVQASGSYTDTLKKHSSSTPIVASTVRITPSEVSIESYMESLSPEETTAKMTLDESPMTIKSPSRSKKSFSSLRSSLRSLLLPSQLSAKLSKKISQASSDGVTKPSSKASTSSVHSN